MQSALANKRIALLADGNLGETVAENVAFLDGSDSAGMHKDAELRAVMQLTAPDDRNAGFDNMDVRFSAAVNVAAFDDPLSLLLGGDTVYKSFMDVAASDQRIAALGNEYADFVTSQVAIFHGASAVGIGKDADFFVMDRAIPDQRIAARNLHAGRLIFEKLTLLDRPPAALIDHEPKHFAFVELAVANNRVPFIPYEKAGV